MRRIGARTSGSPDMLGVGLCARRLARLPVAAPLQGPELETRGVSPPDLDSARRAILLQDRRAAPHGAAGVRETGHQGWTSAYAQAHGLDQLRAVRHQGVPGRRGRRLRSLDRGIPRPAGRALPAAGEEHPWFQLQPAMHLVVATEEEIAASEKALGGIWTYANDPASGKVSLDLS